MRSTRTVGGQRGRGPWSMPARPSRRASDARLLASGIARSTLTGVARGEGISGTPAPGVDPVALATASTYPVWRFSRSPRSPGSAPSAHRRRLIRGTPASRVQGNHPAGELRLGREHGPVRDTADPHRQRPGPRLRQVELAVDRRVTGRSGVGQVDRDLGVLDPARRPGVLPLHQPCGGAFFTSPVSSITSTAPGSPRCSTGVITQVITDHASIPHAPAGTASRPATRPRHAQAMLQRVPRGHGQQPQHENDRAFHSSTQPTDHDAGP